MHNTYGGGRTSTPIGKGEVVFFDNKIDDTASGKNAESLAKSRKLRSKFKAIFGGIIPSSILVHDSSDRAIDLQAKGSYEKASIVYGNPKFSKAEWETFKLSGWGVGSGALSRFPQNIGRILVNFYCPESGLVYDPFAGHNSRMQLVFQTGRDYIGVDISKQFIKHNIKIMKFLKQEIESSLFSDHIPNITLIRGSSAKVNLPNNHADFTVTSPPYWDLEHYGDEPEQLGNAKTYQKFLELLESHIRENYRILKPNTFCCWCINDFRRKGMFYSYHADLIPIFQKVGFTLHAIYIIDLGTGIGQAFVQTIIKTKAFPKRHEYCLVFKKDGVK